MNKEAIYIYTKVATLSHITSCIKECSRTQVCNSFITLFSCCCR